MRRRDTLKILGTVVNTLEIAYQICVLPLAGIPSASAITYYASQPFTSTYGPILRNHMPSILTEFSELSPPYPAP